jgi:predicted neuraminidase
MNRTRRYQSLPILILSFLMSGIPSSRAAERDEKLRPLPYNHAGLEVDLGVGLWAFPMPMDYDKDGDLDLVVACPDKPSNGIYYFENPSQDASVKMPVFKPSIKIGAAVQFMMSSHVNGDPIVMQPGHEFRRDAKTGLFDFSKPKRIYPQDNVHIPGKKIRANMWRYVDYDGDGDHDLIVGVGDWSDLVWDHAFDNRGQWRNGPLHGYVYFIENQGNDESPKYSDSPQRVQAAGGDIDVYGWPSPNFADFDQDGDLDLICGEFLDGFTYFQNIGTRKQPQYAAGQKLEDADGKPLVMHVQMITPTAIDWDNDGDQDLIVGDEDGRVALIENLNQIRNQMPVFAAPKYFQQQADTLKFGALSTPFVYDWDKDGDEDILCGNTAGSIGWFENLGDTDQGTPKWSAPRLLNVKQVDGCIEPFRVMAGENGSIQGPCEAKWGYTTFTVADWDKDGDGDIVYNSILARLGLLINEPGALVPRDFDTGLRESPPAWYWWQTQSPSTLTQWRTTPVLVDFDQDKKLDLIMLDQEGYLTLRCDCKAADRIFVDEDNRPIRLNASTSGASGRRQLAVVDWDGDSRLDVIVNSQNAAWWRNCEDRDGKIVLKAMGNFSDRNIEGHTSSPSICDFNKDGKPDLLIGCEDGRLYHITHEDCRTFTTDQMQAREPKESKPSRFAGLIAEEFVFTKAPFKQCHASTICKTSRGLVAAWFGGTKEGEPDVGIWTSYHDGTNWTAPVEVADGVQHDGLRFPCWNPVLYQPPGDAPTYLFFKVGPSPSKWWGEMMISYDRGRSFRDRQRLPQGIDGPVRCKPLLLKDNQTLLCGSSTEYDGWRVHFEQIRIVDGKLMSPWRRIGPINDSKEFNAIQPTFITHRDGRIEALCRTKEGVISTTSSTDEGLTWTSMKATPLPNPNSGIEAVTLADGRHLLIYNHLGPGLTGWGSRSTLNLAISDDGVNWREAGIVEKEKTGEFSYPAIIQTDDGMVHASYTHKRTRIKHLTIDPAKLVAGDTLP